MKRSYNALGRGNEQALCLREEGKEGRLVSRFQIPLATVAGALVHVSVNSAPKSRIRAE